MEFFLPDTSPEVRVTLTDNITEPQLLKFAAFTNWLATLKSSLRRQTTEDGHAFHKAPYTLRSITILSVSRFGTRIGFVKLIAEIKNVYNEALPGIAFLRGGSVAALLMIRPTDSLDERLVVLTEQPRVPAGSLSFLEIPAGMLDGSGNFVSKAVKEIQEETGLDIPSEELIDMTELALQESKTAEDLQPAMYPSPGGSDEFIAIYLWDKVLERNDFEDLKNTLKSKPKGNRLEGEQITIRLCKYEELWREGARDAKTLAAWSLYEGLKREGVALAKRKMEIENIKKRKVDQSKGTGIPSSAL
jgi:ADP-sugar diphosphatase